MLEVVFHNVFQLLKVVQFLMLGIELIQEEGFFLLFSFFFDIVLNYITFIFRDITDYLSILLRKAGINFHTTAEMEIVNKIKVILFFKKKNILLSFRKNMGIFLLILQKTKSKTVPRSVSTFSPMDNVSRLPMNVSAPLKFFFSRPLSAKSILRFTRHS